MRRAIASPARDRRLGGQMPIAGSVFVVDGVRATRIIRVSVERVEVEDDDEED